ncbi:MAG: class I SAM-dependent methyltransferase [Deltaproteobacteria bacterium]|nr:class I SAM-dependent methyltransferase [Deltaproteobacteria bacterium]
MATEFSDDQFDQAYPDGIENHWWNLARNSILANVVKNFAGAGAVILDVGCGRGFVVEYLRDQGIDCTGVELAKAQPLVSVRDHVRVGIDAWDLSPAERMRYNTILLLDVIEHIPDSAAFLRHLCDGFLNLSHLIITVPACQELWSNYDECYGHCRRYSLEMLKNTSVALGADCISASYFFHLTYPVCWIAAHLAKKRETTLHAPQGIAKWLHKLISWAMIFDYHTLPGCVPGMSALACFSLNRNGHSMSRIGWRCSANSRDKNKE